MEVRRDLPHSCKNVVDPGFDLLCFAAKDLGLPPSLHKRIKAIPIVSFYLSAFRNQSERRDKDVKISSVYRLKEINSTEPYLVFLNRFGLRGFSYMSFSKVLFSKQRCRLGYINVTNLAHM